MHKITPGKPKDTNPCGEIPIQGYAGSSEAYLAIMNAWDHFNVQTTLNAIQEHESWENTFGISESGIVYCYDQTFGVYCYFESKPKIVGIGQTKMQALEDLNAQLKKRHAKRSTKLTLAYLFLLGFMAVFYFGMAVAYVFTAEYILSAVYAGMTALMGLFLKRGREEYKKDKGRIESY